MKRIISIQSHVVFGCAGNSAVVFPMRRMGMEVCPINTVQFSNHTQYQEGWKGMVMPAGHITDLISGLDNIDVLKGTGALLSGYLGSAAQGREVLNAVKKLKDRNPSALYFCDPVMGHPEKGCIVAPEVMDFYRHEAFVYADIIAPNLLELETLTGLKINTFEEVKSACESLIELGVKAVLVKHLSKAAISQNEFEMLLVTADNSYHVTRPLYNFAKQPVGVGDLVSGLMLANLLAGHEMETAFERMNASVDAVLRETYHRNSYELCLIEAQNCIAEPKILHKAVSKNISE